MKKLPTYLKRILGLPFFAGLTLIGSLTLWIKINVNFLRFGGEAIPYTEKNMRRTIADIYYKLEKMVVKDES